MNTVKEVGGLKYLEPQYSEIGTPEQSAAYNYQLAKTGAGEGYWRHIPFCGEGGRVWTRYKREVVDGCAVFTGEGPELSATEYILRYRRELERLERRVKDEIVKDPS